MHRSRTLLLAALCLIVRTAAAQSTNQTPTVDLSGLAQATRPVSATYPVSGAPRVFISNKFGSVRVTPWNEQLVRVSAEIKVGADTTAIAEQLAQQVNVTGSHADDRVEVKTAYPNLEPTIKAGFITDIEVNVPANASVNIMNEWGDVFVRGLKGSLTVKAKFGIVEVRDLHGAVHVQASGGLLQLPLIAEDLHAGGTFTLRSTEATFSRVSGELNVHNHIGGVNLRPGAEPMKADISCESGPIHLYLDGAALPDLVATANGGEIHSDLALISETWGNLSTGRNPDPDAAQKIELTALFADIHVHQTALMAAAKPLAPSAGELFTQAINQGYDLPVDGTVRLNLMPGNVTIEGHDGPRVELKATQFVRMADVANTQLALEGLALRAEPTATSVAITTAVLEDMAAIGCTEYRMDMTLRVPRGAPLEVRTNKGITRLSDINGTVTLEQEQGEIILRDMQGPVTAKVKQGRIESTATAGAIDFTAGGDVTVRQALGAVRAQSDGGTVLIDTPGGPVFARGRGGDVRLIALGGVRGDYDIQTEDGNISLAVPPDADAMFVVNAYGGTIFSSASLTGTIQRDIQTFTGRLNDATYRVMVESRRGNIVID